ncbi:VOC family protein [Variovorax sp. H27-G14]|uniref:VOC family protein n=1 Tax=Variovorax sp. H27-G14 TaxID=3111914 RepID=UPI0038FCC4EC
MTSSLQTLILYARNTRATAAFYCTHFGFASSLEVVEGLIELRSSSGGASLLIHQAASSVKLGQVGVKLMFDVQDIEGFKQKAAAQGLAFGATHQANGYAFANAKDPDGNSVAISSRAFRGVAAT